MVTTKQILKGFVQKFFRSLDGVLHSFLCLFPNKEVLIGVKHAMKVKLINHLWGHHSQKRGLKERVGVTEDFPGQNSASVGKIHVLESHME